MRRNAKEMNTLLAQFRSGDLSSAAFCEQHQINKHTFRYWLYRTKPSSSDNFIPLLPDRKASTGISGPQTVELRFPNGVVVSTSSHNLDLITALLHSV
jgi:hypothetical protein